MKLILQITLIVILGALLSSDVQTQNEKYAQLVEVGANFFAVIGPEGNGNTAFLVTEEGVVVIDAGKTPEIGRTLLTLIREKTDKPIRYILLTHYHTDHVLGLEAFPEPALVVGHENLFRNMQEILSEELKAYPELIKNLKTKIKDMQKQGSSDLEQEKARLKRNIANHEILRHSRIMLPEITFDNRLVFQLEDERIEMYYPGPTHTNDSSVIYFPGRKTIHMGDMVFAGYHSYIDERAGADTKNWLSFLEQVMNWDIDTVIPGHGPIGGKEHLEKEIKYLQDLRAEVSAAIKEGKTEEDVINTVKMERWKELMWPDILPLVIQTVYQELASDQKQDVKKNMEGNNSLVLQSRYLNESRDIFVHIPESYKNSDKNYPVLYVLDAEDVFSYAAGTVDFLSTSYMPEAIVVGIPNTHRERDQWVTLEPDGGYLDFINFLEKELVPFIDKNYRTCPYRVFYGFCSGSGIAFYILFTQPQIFDGYIASGTGFDRTWADRASQSLKQFSILNKSLYAVTEGSTPRAEGMPLLRSVLETSAPPGLDWDCEILEGEEHGPVLARGLFAGLRFIFRGWILPVNVASQGQEAVKEYYRQLSNAYGFKTGIPEQPILNAASSLFWNGQRHKAIEIFQFLAVHHPHSSDVFEFLGLAYEEENELEQAKKAYETALRIAEQNKDRRLPRFEEYVVNIKNKIFEKSHIGDRNF